MVHVAKDYNVCNKIRVQQDPNVEELGRIALTELTHLYNKGTNKIKNKKIRKILQSDQANILVDMGAEYGQQKQEKKT